MFKNWSTFLRKNKLWSNILRQRQKKVNSTFPEIAQIIFSTKHLHFIVKKITFLKKNSVHPVSYTHLDVYKRQVQMIPQKDLQKTTGYVHGANNPVGIRQKHNFPIYIDQSAQEAGFLIVSAGEIGRSIRINSQELADFVNAEFADIKAVSYTHLSISWCLSLTSSMALEKNSRFSVG